MNPKLQTTLLAVVSATILRSTTAYCPPTGPVLPPPTIQNADFLTTNLTQTLQEVSQVSQAHFNLTTTSFSVQITSPDVILYEFHHTASVRNTSGVDKVDGDSVYRIASVTKMMTVYALLLQKGVNLDEPVTKYVPGLLDAGLDNYRNVTLRMLASQISGTARDGIYFDYFLRTTPEIAEALGFPDDDFPADYPHCDMAATPRCTMDDFFDMLRAGSAPWRPGQRAAYANLPFVLISLALENITGLPYADVIRQYITEPLGLSSTGFDVPPLEEAIIPVGNGSWSVSTTIGVYNATAGLYSTPNDLSRIAQSILSHSLLSEAQTNVWLKPAAFTSSSANAVGAPWEIFLPNNLAHSPRPTEIYTKEGAISGYGTLFGLIPEFNIGINVISAGDDASIVTRYVFDQVVQDFGSKLDQLARSQAQDKYAGRYDDGSVNGTLVLSVDDGPGLKIEEWTSNGVSMLQSWAMLKGLDAKTAEARAYPVGEGERWQVSMALQTPIGLWEKACEEWIQISEFWYKGLPADEFDFQLKDGAVVGVKVPGLRQDLTRGG